MRTHGAFKMFIQSRQGHFEHKLACGLKQSVTKSESFSETTAPAQTLKVNVSDTFQEIVTRKFMKCVVKELTNVITNSGLIELI